jgi:2-polyprenyl-3-methyl-5-hydroxy-6-metoxy-1,4-benzoquinol methylase
MRENTTEAEEKQSALREIYTSGLYLEKNPDWHVYESPWKAKQIIRMLKQNNLSPESICEVGCGAGEVLRQLQKQLDEKCTFWGYDISPQAIAMANTRTNEKLHFKLADILKEPPARHDLILVMDVLEHVEDRFGFLRGIQDRAEYKMFQVSLTISVQTVLRKNGLLKAREAYGMVNYFTKELLLQTFKDAGYEIVDCFYTTSCTDIPSKELVRNLVKYPRKILFALNQDAAARILGGYRLLVLTR